jgi:hypothetical protein
MTITAGYTRNPSVPFSWQSRGLAFLNLEPSDTVQPTHCSGLLRVPLLVGDVLALLRNCWLSRAAWRV